MTRDQDSYLSQLQDLLPIGIAWTRAPSANLTKLLNIFARVLATTDQKSLSVLDQSDPRTVSDLLTDWENIAGLPDQCIGIPETIQQRRALLHSKITRRGGQSKAFYTAIAQALGYQITITEYRPFITGISCCGDTLNGAAINRYVWSVSVEGIRLTYFRTGLSRTGERLLSIEGADDLECILNHLKPAHTKLIFNYA